MIESVRYRQHAVKASSAPNPRTLAGDVLSHLVVQVFQLNNRLLDAGDALARPAGQTSARWQVLAAADHAPMSVAQIARALSLARQSVQRIADLLEADGLVVYKGNPAHQRAKLLLLTLKGRQALRKIQIAQVAWANALGAKIGESELRQTSVVLGRLLELLPSRIGPAE
ncbi:MAG TPA: MarR family winged helix-turn-helix transcriptional regulator [Chthoniobacterales bacterium]|jgi:DNA-binding MarR family transcriptional regulator|nr:MarR family winged helix-turn-helix transcriptional regulator [Chthoniobacterales bacterium]